MPQSPVYRNLAVLEEVGAVRRVVTEGGIARYELAEDLTRHHHHLVCRTCGTVEDVMIAAGLERTIQRALGEVAASAGFQSDGHRLDLIGTCHRCSRASATA